MTMVAKPFPCPLLALRLSLVPHAFFGVLLFLVSSSHPHALLIVVLVSPVPSLLALGPACYVTNMNYM